MANDSPEGWVKALWGMTEKEVRAQYPTATTINPPEDFHNYYAPLVLSNVNIANENYDVKFQFSKTGQILRQVLITPSGIDPFEVAEWQVFGVFDHLKQIVSERYGYPSFTNSEKVSWAFPKTRIEIQLLNNDGFKHISLIYSSVNTDLHNVL